MNLEQIITPKNENGSVDHRYIPIAQSIVELAGERVEVQLRKIFSATTNLEKESASAGLQLVIDLFSIPMDERYERSKFKKQIREQLQEIGFKPSKVSKLMGAGEFYARHHNCPYSEDPFGCYFSEPERVDRQNRFLNEYFKDVSKLYELSCMNETAVDRVRQEYLDDNKVYAHSELEELRHSNPKERNKGRAGKRNSLISFLVTSVPSAISFLKCLRKGIGLDLSPLTFPPCKIIFAVDRIWNIASYFSVSVNSISRNFNNIAITTFEFGVDVPASSKSAFIRIAGRN